MAFTNQTLPISEIMEYFYAVPDYQRGYVWDQERVSDFIGSIIDHFETEKSKSYFIGAAVFESTKDSNRYFVVDGQQRLSTIFIIICAAYNLLKLYGANEKLLTSVLAEYLSKYNRKEEINQLKIEHTDPDCKNAFNSILNGNDQIPSGVSRSAENIFVAYKVAKTILQEKCEEEEVAVKKDKKQNKIKILENFIDHFEKTTILPFISQSRDESLTVFETLNSKGVGLSNIDILKSLLFESVKEDDDAWDELTKHWNSFVNLFEPLKIPPNKFLRYVVVTQFKTPISVAKCLDWLRENDDLTMIRANPLSLIAKLTLTAKAIKNIRAGHAADGKPNMFLNNMLKLAPSAEQQYFLLIPLWNANQAQFSQACAIAESVLFLNKILAHYTGSTEKNFIFWGRDLSQLITSPQEYENYIFKIKSELQSENKKLEAVLLQVSLTNTSKSLVNWILKRCELYASLISSDDSHINLGVEIYQSVDIEHIEPSSSKELTEEFIHKLGNLTIQEKGFNRANGKMKFDDKKISYSKSKYKMTNALVGMPSSGGQHKKAFELFYSSDDWSAQHINARTGKIVETTLKALSFI
jgi:hypothetical protein